MPHKHRRVDHDESQFNLPPTVRAASLPVGPARSFNTTQKGKKRKAHHVQGYGEDDTPKAFQRLMSFSKGGVKKRPGLDDGASSKPKNKTKKSPTDTTATNNATTASNTSQQQTNTLETPHVAQSSENNEPLRIQPGESIPTFNARVNQALPLSGISRSSKKVAGISSHRVTAHERRLKRLQKGWREEEARLREKEQEERELAEEEIDEHAAIWGENKLAEGFEGQGKTRKKRKKNGKKKLVVGEVDNNSDDEWEALQRTRGGERKGLHDVVSAPPTFDRVPREIFKIKNGAGAKVGNVPNAVGSLRKREQLGEERTTIIDTYRELMASKRKE